ncbi:MAG: hypothetical protein J3R72DRAFT_518840 [Linnemannia gamsii]|nr:MAG: hypothetical protein J3R72DRAFT_518840 [Linnemannia gamsii]
MSILELPDEIIYHLLTYAEDTDFPVTISTFPSSVPPYPSREANIALSCKRLRSLTLDGPLRRHILLIRTPARLSVSLSSPTRPTRDALVKQNILRGIHLHQHIQQGQYIGGASSVRSYQISCRLERQMVSIRIAKKLKCRPDWTEMVERGLIPEEMFVMKEEYETKRRWKMYQLQQRNQRLLVQQQQQRQEQQEQWGMKEDADEKEEREKAYSYYGKLPDLQYEPMQVDGVHPFDSDSNTDQPTPLLPQLQPAQESNTYATSASLTERHTTSRAKRQKKSISNVLIPKIELLRKAMDRDRLSRLVQRRPSPSELNQSPTTATVLHAYHLIAYSSTSKDLVPLTAQLNFLLKGERLSHWLYQRPSLAVVLNERHMLRTEVRTAWMVCPGVSKKVRFYEGLIQEHRDYEQQLQEFFFQHQQNQHRQQTHPDQQQVELIPVVVS